MPLDVRGCTRATLSGSACVYPSPRGVGNPLNPTRDRDWGLQLFPMNEEFPVNLRKDHYRFSPSIRGERNKQKPKPRGGSEGRALAVSAASASLFSPSPRRARAPAVKRQVARAPTATDSEPRLPSGTFSPAVHRQMKNTHLSASSKGRGNRAGGSAGGSRRVLRPASHRDRARKTRNTDSSAVRRPRPGRPPCASGYLTPLPPPGAGVRGSMPPPPAAAPAGAGRSARRYCYPHIVKPNAAVSAAFVPLSADVSGCPVRLARAPGPPSSPSAQTPSFLLSRPGLRVRAWGAPSGSPLCVRGCRWTFSLRAARVPPGACHARVSFGERGGAGGGWAGSRGNPASNAAAEHQTQGKAVSLSLRRASVPRGESHVVSSSGAAPHSTTTSDQTRQPAEFKHITKRRKRN
ncbi:hypothetical protein NQZ68_040694 [Dissostichus eleginoides]|nr:hypothetical protein NQZ68_040694 [Dissostichus eleginoides]